jgi:hypothetical protein
LALWLVAWSVHVLASPQEAVIEASMPMAALLPVAAISFAVGVFLFTGFMSRVCGLLLACLGAWQLAAFGPSPQAVVEPLVGVYLMLRGGGAWAMDIYVQKMQDRIRQKSISSPESW